MSRAVKFQFLCAILISLVLATGGCKKKSAATGGGAAAGSSTSSSTVASAASVLPAILLTGRASAGPISNATVTGYRLNSNGSRGLALGHTTTDATGNYSLAFNAGGIPLQIVVSGGSYLEEATGNPVSLAGKELTALVTSVSSSGSSVSITPLSHMAAQRAIVRAAGGADVNSSIVDANVSIAKAAGLPDGTDVTKVIPANPHATMASQGLAANSPEAKVALLLASISQLGQTSGGGDSIAMANSFANDFKSDGTFSGTTWSSDLKTAQDTVVAAHDFDFGASAKTVPISLDTAPDPTVIISTPNTVASYIDSSDVGSLVIAGTCNVDGTISVTVSDASANQVSKTTTCTNSNWTVTLNTSKLNETTSSDIVISVTDSASNKTGSASTLALNKDTQGPTIVFDQVSGVTFNQVNIRAVTISGTGCGVGSVALKIAAGKSSIYSKSIACSGGAFATALPMDLSDQSDGTLTVTGIGTDNHGNAGAEASYTMLKNTAEPTIFIQAVTAVADFITAADANQISLTGTCDIDATIDFTIHDDQKNIILAPGVPCLGGQFAVNIDTTILAETTGSSIVIAAVGTTDIGNTSSTAAYAFLDKVTVAPTISEIDSPAASTIIGPSNSLALPVAGACSKDGQIDYTVTDSHGIPFTASTPCSQGSFTDASMDISGFEDTLNDGLTLTMTITDAQGNFSASDPVYFSKKTRYENRALAGHSAGVFAADPQDPQASDKMIVFGGINSQGLSNLTYLYDPRLGGSWSQIYPTGITPPARQGAASTVIGDNMILFSGVNGKGIPIPGLFAFNQKANTWKVLKPSGPAPEPRGYASAVTIAGKMYLFGGLLPTGHASNELWVYDPAAGAPANAPKDTNGTWTRIPLQGPVIPVYAHAAAALNNVMYIHGGHRDNIHGPVFDQFFSFAPDGKNAAGGVWMDLRAPGPVPLALAGHSLFAEGPALYMFGGFGDNQKATENTVRSYMPTAAPGAAWNIVPIKGSSPSPRSGQSVVMMGATPYLFGGEKNGVYNSELFSLRLPDKGVPMWTGLISGNTGTPGILVDDSVLGQFITQSNVTAYTVFGTCADIGTLTLDTVFDGDPSTSLPQLTVDCLDGSWSIDVDFSALNKTQTTGNLNITVAGYGAANSDEEVYKGDDYTFQIPMEVQGPITYITSPVAGDPGATLVPATSAAYLVAGLCALPSSVNLSVTDGTNTVSVAAIPCKADQDGNGHWAAQVDLSGLDSTVDIFFDSTGIDPNLGNAGPTNEVIISAP